MEITITIPEHQMEMLKNAQKELMDRGFNSRESEIWAALYCREYGNRVEEVSEKVIQMFGANLLHSFNNIKHFASILKEHGDEHKIKLLSEAI